MRKTLYLLLLLISLSGCLTNCSKFGNETNMIHVISAKYEQFFYKVGSVFLGYHIKYDSIVSRFFSNNYSTYPEGPENTPLLIVEQRIYQGLNYDETLTGDQIVERICINGLNESLGLGSTLDIPMHQGQYTGKNELVKNVQLGVFHMPDYEENEENYLSFNITITSIKGDKINIIINKITPVRHDFID